ncbi:EpsD family peptidyl-prolyl cis-trans isomerase [Nitrosomonas sp.]|uniref:EpsD family peptidyl-prolyl cis-trans isomerase n=1 Tax=Nitrosomonas sp. TaxID=42353 RepID=UPI001D66EBB2|nr:EpsD family peptidyl-prolyl cis-trans isomerase [Nitrosomonas sp.]MBX3616240.1 EpsD family peptidyl-prolyl cis-trans isomerase [Nitrosomonas sp.]
MVLAYLRMFLFFSVAITVTVVLTACDKEPAEKKSGQALASVNGKEITMLQLNDEIRRANVRPDQYDAASKQLLESLISRQLIVDEAVRNKLDRTPEVMQARERVNAQVITQAYLQGVMSKVAKPSKAEIDEYFQKHPEFFTQRKQFDLAVVRIATKDLSEELRKILDTAKTLDEVVLWLEKNKIQYIRNVASRSTADLPPQMATVLQEKSKDTIFIVNEQETSSLIYVNAIKESPITLAAAAPQIEKFLMNQKLKAATDAEIARLRTAAQIEYLNLKDQKPNTGEPATQPPVELMTDSLNGLDTSAPIPERAIERGITGFK